MKSLTGYVATLDILGFEELLKRDDHSDVLKDYMNCMEAVLRPLQDTVEGVLFSDSVVLTASDKTDDAFGSLIMACSSAFYALLSAGIPVRGAIAYGEYWREYRSKSVFLAGNPIVEAYRREKSQEWVGTLLCPSVLRKQTDLAATLKPRTLIDLLYEKLEQPNYEQPLELLTRLQPAIVPCQDEKGVSNLSGYAVVPMPSSPPQLNYSRAIIRVKSATTTLEELRLQASQPRAQRKYEATIAWLEQVRETFQQGQRITTKVNKDFARFQEDPDQYVISSD